MNDIVKIWIHDTDSLNTPITIDGCIEAVSVNGQAYIVQGGHLVKVGKMQTTWKGPGIITRYRHTSFNGPNDIDTLAYQQFKA